MVRQFIALAIYLIQSTSNSDISIKEHEDAEIQGEINKGNTVRIIQDA